ncbi:hypothetical protein FUSO6_07730 [Fusobacterium necrophorum DAB]|uniref:Four-carbon acid sugar kinase N-terminal domain-containing protein n=1 Tax=Fusobacterium necrophorum BL TaxID=1441732 RepID=A0AB73BUB2_9FUSO|nr:hypothetical protein FUSO3_09470 [Fusobacterium necrophorum BL]KDE68921.1 hypothetical protein FUSO6_07730 [Fusobacterium necrophorum DAB]KDE74641.1 hypothetical protein FUSO7_01825 [Fusobacterium necrophorum BFTR-2]SDB28881.1 GntP family permease [Fusobacterium necrophorum]SQD09859.1 GntP family permease [Fusobacterium necrophorum subsp. necrophorum]
MVKYVIVADDLTGSNATCSLSSCVEELIKKQTKYTSHYFNDSFFWVINRSIGITEGKEQLRLYSIASTVAWAVGIVVLLIINMIFG